MKKKQIANKLCYVRLRIDVIHVGTESSKVEILNRSYSHKRKKEGKKKERSSIQSYSWVINLRKNPGHRLVKESL